MVYAVIAALKQYQAGHLLAQAYGVSDISHIHTDAGSQFTSDEFCQYCHDKIIHLVLAAPKKQYQNHLAEWSWQTISPMAHSLVAHAQLPDTFWYHALQYYMSIFNVLPVHRLLDEKDSASTPYEMFYKRKPNISRFCTFGCPTVIRCWVTKNNTNGKQTGWGTRGIFIGFDMNSKGYLMYAPGSLSDDVVYDETFATAITATWQQHQDSLALRPVSSHIPDIDATLEHTRTIEH
jgi:hypothetical protein